MLVDCYTREDVFAQVPKLAHEIDPVLRKLDGLLDDDTLYQQVRADFGKRYRSTLVHGRHSTPVEVLLRMLILKHLYQWSYKECEGRVADSLVLQLARQARVTKGRKLRLDATCVQTNIHHPTDSGLLVDSVRVLSRFVQRAKGLVKDQMSNVQQACRSRLRTARQVAQTLHRQLRRKVEEKEAQQKELYQKLIGTTEHMVRQSQQVIAALAEQTGQQARRLLRQAEHVLPLVQGVIAQTRTRVLEGKKMASEQKVLSLFEPHTRAIPRHKGGALVEFGRHVILDEVEGGIVTRFQILEHPTEHGQAIEAVAHHQALFAHPPGLVAGDRGVQSAETEERLKAAGVKRVAIPAAGKLSPERQALERTRTWRRGYRWRAGIEGRIASLRRDYGWRRSGYHGEDGMERWLGLGVIASNLRHVAQATVTHAHNKQAA